MTSASGEFLWVHDAKAHSLLWVAQPHYRWRRARRHNRHAVPTPSWRYRVRPMLLPTSRILCVCRSFEKNPTGKRPQC